MSAPHDTREKVNFGTGVPSWEALMYAWRKRAEEAESTLRGLEEENARLKAEVANYGRWVMLHSVRLHEIGLRINDEAPKEEAWFNERAEKAEAELATLRASQRTGEDGWVDLKDGGMRPTGEDHLLIVLGPEGIKMQCVGYWNRLMKTWLVNGEPMDGLDVTYFKILDWPPSETGGAA